MSNIISKLICIQPTNKLIFTAAQSISTQIVQEQYKKKLIIIY
jgi:hypothetical protein